DLAILVADQGRPVEVRLADVPAVTGRVLEMLGKLRGIDEQFLRHAAADDAGAAEAMLLGDRHAQALRCSKAAGTDAAGAAADDEEVVVEICHASLRCENRQTASLEVCGRDEKE